MDSGFFLFWSLGPAPEKGQAMAGGRDVRLLLSQIRAARGVGGGKRKDTWEVDGKEKPSFELQEEGRVSLFILALINSTPWCHQSSNHRRQH